MRDREYARRSRTSFGEYVAASTALLGGFFLLLVASSYPVMTVVAVGSAVVGFVSPRIVHAVSELVCRLRGNCPPATETPSETA